MIDESKIRTQVGDSLRTISQNDFVTVHGELAEELRAAGLVGLALDEAIVARLPMALAKRIDGVVVH